MDKYYPAGPAVTVGELTKPTGSYRLQAWLAMSGLLLFVLLYLALSGWFGWSSYRLLDIAANHHGGLAYWIVGLCSGFLALFMVKALFFVRRGGQPNDLEVTRAEEPRLFEFLDRLADEAGAPRPHRVFLSARVNAAVFYDLSLLNLLLPSRKNLEIGLGLVNVLTLSELKAVLAHEFGHFAQRSMAVGRWVYIAQQIAAHIIERRDALDSFLRFLSSIDLRVAWIGWLLRLVVWSLRALLETAFSLVVLAQRALSREMEFQADRVAVALTGSDALVHALHRLQAADEAWDRALGFVGQELHQGAATRDIFAVQLRILERMRKILNDPDYGVTPALPSDQPEAHRVFQAEIAQPPRMWATHPHNHEREENAKRVYVPCPLDARSAWLVFQDPQALRERATAHLLGQAEAQPKQLEESLSALDGQFSHQFLHSIYRGSYLGRSVVRHTADVDELYLPDLEAALSQLPKLYPDSLVGELEELRNLEREVALLDALHARTYTPPDGVIRHRGQELKRRELPGAIARVRAEFDAVQTRVHGHDRLCRSAHLAAAQRLGQGWDKYLRGLLTLLHYADHSEANLRDAQGYVGNVVNVVLADRQVTAKELQRLLKACGELYEALGRIHDQASTIRLDPRVAEQLGVAQWAEALGSFELPPPSRDNINDWMSVIDNWVNATAGALGALRQAALEQLLAAESAVARHLREETAAPEAPPPSRVPATYAVLVPGSERKRQTRLGLWDRFQTADGIVAGVARFAVSGAIVGSALVLGGVLLLPG